MLIHVTSEQVPKYWNEIKFAAVKSDDIKKEYLETYCFNLLQDLLSGVKNVLFGLNADGNNIEFIMIYSINIEQDTGIKYFYGRNLFSFKHQEKEKWQQVYEDVLKIAQKNDCTAIVSDTKNPRLVYVFESIGFKLFTQKFYNFI